MTYLQIKSLINDAYADFVSDYVIRKTLGADNKLHERQVAFVKVIYKTLMNQSGDETLDLLTTENIQDIIILFNKHCHATVPIEYI